MAVSLNNLETFLVNTVKAWFNNKPSVNGVTLNAGATIPSDNTLTASSTNLIQSGTVYSETVNQNDFNSAAEIAAYKTEILNSIGG